MKITVGKFGVYGYGKGGCRTTKGIVYIYSVSSLRTVDYLLNALMYSHNQCHLGVQRFTFAYFLLVEPRDVSQGHERLELHAQYSCTFSCSSNRLTVLSGVWRSMNYVNLPYIHVAF